VQVMESSEGQGSFVVCIPGSAMGAVPVNIDRNPNGDVEPAGLVLRTAGASAAPANHANQNSPFAAFRPRDFRKAIRKGNLAARAFLLESVRTTVRLGAHLIQESAARRLVLAGGALDENKAEGLAEARQALQAELGVPRASRVSLSISDLGDQAALQGAAILASRTRTLAARRASSRGRRS